MPACLPALPPLPNPRLYPTYLPMLPFLLLRLLSLPTRQKNSARPCSIPAQPYLQM
ncbi:hypothetical protein BS50DRAFT_568127 [Corynespora cassiicola Philippines]|uniref:Uncharacterized protein n=1 Tax=Corynespora cassiicola Philippines TaxID=1448308 RepID=A0A2T2PCX8_CORCC|nr:hypothetical protein BS50DRAFT_568127 [Corynespora cassiicola Philippines]